MCVFYDHAPAFLELFSQSYRMAFSSIRIPKPACALQEFTTRSRREILDMDSTYRYTNVRLPVPAGTRYPVHRGGGSTVRVHGAYYWWLVR